VRLHDPKTGTTTLIANLGDAALPQTLRVYTNSEDGLYGPAVDPNFATNKWVYLYYAPQTVQDVKLSTGQVVTQTTPNTTPPNSAPSVTAWDPYVGYFQLSRFKFVEDANGARLDLNSEQQIIRVSNNRQECCHVAGDIDFDKHGNLWMVTGDDTPAAGIHANGFGPFEDELTDEQQTVRVNNATGGTFTLTFDGQTTAPIAYNASRDDIDAALEALSNVGADQIQVSGGTNVSTSNVNVFFRRSFHEKNVSQLTANASGLTGNSPAVAVNTSQEGGWYQRPTGDDRRSTLNTNDLRGKVLRIHVKDTIASGDQNKADTGSGSGAYTIPTGNLKEYSAQHYPAVAGQPGFDTKFRPEIYAMGFRNPFRLQVDENDVAYVTDYSPDSQTPQRSRGPSGVGRMEIVRHPANYGYPQCYSTKLGYYKWSFQEFAPGTTTVGVPADNPPQPIDCGNQDAFVNPSRWTRDGGPGFEPGLANTPPLTDPDIWYSYRDNNAANPLGTPCFGYYATTPGTPAPGSTTECPRLFPELYQSGVAPHGAVKYHYDPNNPSKTKFPPYYDNSVFLGEFNVDTLREVKLDSQNRIFKINSLLDCGQALITTAFEFECDNPMDMQFGADGSYYLLTYGDGFFNINPDAGMYRFDYVKGQRAPKAVLTTDRTDGPAPLTVQFNGSGSSDPDPGDSITYQWDFGDGSAMSTEANPTHTYTKAGRYTAVLTVTDSAGKETKTSTVITAGNTSPTITIDAPVDGGLFSFGDTLQFKVHVTDPEQSSVDCNDVQVTFVLGHETHGHAEQTTTGCTGFLNTVASDVTHGGNVFGVISVRYTDKGGSNGEAPPLQTIAEVQLRQKREEVEFVTNQSGTQTATDTDTTGNNGAVHRSSIGSSDWLQLNGPFNLQGVDSLAIRYADASNGRTVGSPLGGIDIRQDSIDGPVIATADLTSTGGNDTWATTTVPLQNVQAGKHELFVTFRTVDGGASSRSLFNLNWVEFGGNGVTVQHTDTPGSVGGSVPATLALTLGTPASFGAFTPGIAKTYTASTTANVISTAGDATLSVADPSSTATGHLVNGAFSLPQALQAQATSPAGAGGALADVGGSSAPTTLLTYGGPVSNDPVAITFSQKIGANDALRTGSYGKTLTFTLSTTTP
jgi:PKD repeat protein